MFSEESDSILIEITGSQAKSHYTNHPPSYAHDGNYNTFYSVKDHDTTGNYLKLFLDKVYHVSHVDVTNRLQGFHDRFAGTQVKVITRNNNRKTDCGTVTGLQIPTNIILLYNS